MAVQIQISSSAFVANGAIPAKFTGEGSDISPALTFSGVPAAARQLALICEDPDAPRPEPFVHWVLYGLPGQTTTVPENLPKELTLAEPSAVQGLNSWERPGFNGPLPPKGHGVHHYHFRLYALDKALDLPPGLDKPKLLAALKPHVIEEGELVGTYERK